MLYIISIFYICQIYIYFIGLTCYSFKKERILKLHRFFVDSVYGDKITIKGEDKDHIVKSLRMKLNEVLVVCDGNLNDYVCRIEEIKKYEVILSILERLENKSEPSINIHLYQAVPKLCKIDFIIQKAVELGVKSITPFVSRYCVAQINCKNVENKINRFKKIAKQAAQQSGRGIIPCVNNVLNFDGVLKDIKKFDFNILFYEYGKNKLNSIKLNNKKDMAIIIGSEGGFCEEEVNIAKKQGVLIGSLGSRILRCETAPICAISILMYITGNL